MLATIAVPELGTTDNCWTPDFPLWETGCESGSQRIDAALG